MSINLQSDLPITLDTNVSSLLPVSSWPLNLHIIVPYMSAFYKSYLEETVYFSDPDIRDVLLLGRRPNQTLALIELALLTNAAQNLGQKLIGPKIVDYFTGKTDEIPITFSSLNNSIKAPSLLWGRRLLRTASWTPYYRLPKTILRPDAISLTHNSLLRSLLPTVSDNVRNGYDVDFVKTNGKRDEIFYKKIDVSGLSIHLESKLTANLPLSPEIHLRLSKILRKIFQESYQDATNLLSSLRVSRDIPKKIYTGTGNKKISRALGLEVLRREGEAIRCDHGGSISLLHPPEYVALNELSVSSKFVVATQNAASLPEINDAILKTKPIRKCSIESASGDPGLDVGRFAFTKAKKNNHRRRIMYVPSLFYGINQASPPVLGGPQYMAWQERLITLLRSFQIDLLCQPHPGGQKPPRNLNPARDIPIPNEKFEKAIALADILIYDFPATTTLAVGLCSDRAIVLLDHGTMRFNASIISEIEKRCTLLTCNYDEYNIPDISRDILENAICEMPIYADPEYFRSLFIGK